MTAGSGPRAWALSQRLGVRLALVIAVALLPLAIVSAMQSQAVLREALARSEAALAGATFRAAAREIALMRRGSGAAEALSVAVPAVVDDNDACSRVMRDFVIGASDVFSFAGFIPADGHMTCSSTGRPHLFDSPERDALLANPRPEITVNRNGQITGRSVLIFSHPVFNMAGTVQGFVSITMPHSALESATASEGSGSPLALVTFGTEGTILSSSVPLADAAAALPADRTLVSLAGDRAVSFTTRSIAGEQRIFSVVPLANGQLYALGTWPTSRASVGTLPFVSPAVLPLLMWAGSLIVALVAIERLVARHMRRLRRAITAFAGGDRLVGDLNFAQAPAEIRETADAFEQMTETILHDEAELEDMVHQKEVLLREVHHRVKNNLQLIASIMNMQVRQTRSPEAKMLIQRLQERVMSLATVHRGLYQTTGLTDVRADELLPDIVRQIVAIATGPGRRFEVSTEVDDIRLTPDQAVPLSLLLTEALTNAIKYAGAPDGAPPRLAVSLRREAGGRSVCLAVTNSAAPGEVPPDDPRDGTGLGGELITAFALQLGGRIERRLEDGLYRLSVNFDVEPLTVAELRNREPATT